MSAPSKQLLDEIYRRKIVHSRTLTPEQRLLASLQHSDEMVKLMRAGVRSQFPQVSEEEIDRILIERVRRVKRLEQRR